MAQDNRAAPPNTSQVEAANYDLDEATENQQGELDEEGVADLNAQIAEEQKEAREFWEENRAERVEASEGAAVADPLKPSAHDKEQRAKDREDADKKNEAARKQREADAKKASEDAKKGQSQSQKSDEQKATDQKLASERAASGK